MTQTAEKSGTVPICSLYSLLAVFTFHVITWLNVDLEHNVFH